jgi:hypothetical protein
LLIKNQFLDISERRRLSEYDIVEHHIRQIHTRCSDFPLRTNARIRIQESHLTTGLFLEGNISEINSIQILLNNNSVFKIPKYFFGNVFKQFSPTLLWIPFQPRADPWLSDDYRGAINLDRIDAAEIVLSFDTPQSQIKVHKVIANLLRTGVGGAAIVFGRAREQQQWTTENKSIDNDRTLCPITHEDIVAGDTYCQCSTCTHNFKSDSLKQAFENSINSSCPMCRSSWSNWIIYTA